MLDIWTGLRPASPDTLPIIGADPRAAGGFLWAAGHSSSGIMQAPATAQVLVDLVLGRKPRIPLGKVGHRTVSGLREKRCCRFPKRPLARVRASFPSRGIAIILWK